MKLLVVSHPCVTALNQQFFAEVERLSNWDLTILIPANWQNEYGESLIPERWPGFRGRLLSIPVWKPGNIPLHVYRSTFLSLLRTRQPDVLYVHHEPHAAATAQLFLANRWSIRCTIGFYSAQNILKRYPPPFRQTERLVLQESQFAFPVSQRVEQVLREKGYQGNSIVLPLGIDPELYSPHPEAKELKQTLHGSADRCLIGYLGRIAEEKGLKTLLQALDLIRNLPWQLVVVGTGPYEHPFDSLARRLDLGDRIQRLGFIPHVQAPLYLSAFDLLVLPSVTRPHWKEQFGRVIIEALACGTPVVGSNSGEIPYLLQDTGGGLIFPEGEVEILAERLQQLVLDPALRQHLAERGRAVVLQEYTNAVLARRFVSAVEMAVQSRRP